MLQGNVADLLVQFDKLIREKAQIRLRIDYGADVAKSMAQILSEPIRDVLGITEDENASNPFATLGGTEKNMNAFIVIERLALRMTPYRVDYAEGVITISIRNE